MKLLIEIYKIFKNLFFKIFNFKFSFLHKQKIAAVMCVKNEEQHLPTFLKHIQKYVDFIIAIDDGSTDSTYKILTTHPLCKKVIQLPIHNSEDWDEDENRKLVINLAKEYNADWVLCCDPDESFELKFLKKLRKIISKNKLQTCYHLNFKECWGKYDTYRDDGIWKNKSKGILFPLSDNLSFDYRQKHHIVWYHNQIKNHVALNYNIYHLKMIKQKDREKRKNLYNNLDPNCLMQKIGYDYLTDTTGIELTKIPHKKRYEYSLIPEDLKSYDEFIKQQS